MKFFIVSAAILLSIALACTVGTIESTKRIDKMIETLSSLEPDNQEVPTGANLAIKSLETQWKKNEFIISMLLPHHHLDEVKEKLVSLASYTQSGEFAEWQEAKNIFLEELTHIRSIVGVSADNIL